MCCYCCRCESDGIVSVAIAGESVLLLLLCAGESVLLLLPGCESVLLLLPLLSICCYCCSLNLSCYCCHCKYQLLLLQSEFVLLLLLQSEFVLLLLLQSEFVLLLLPLRVCGIIVATESRCCYYCH